MKESGEARRTPPATRSDWLRPECLFGLASDMRAIKREISIRTWINYLGVFISSSDRCSGLRCGQSHEAFLAWPRRRTSPVIPDLRTSPARDGLSLRHFGMLELKNTTPWAANR
jgi:hypothetical protein